MKEVLVALIFCSMIVSVMGFGAFLIYKGSSGWGWYLFVALLILGSVRLTVD